MSLFGLFNKARDPAWQGLFEALERIPDDDRRVSGDAILLGVKSWPADWDPGFQTQLTRKSFPRRLHSAKILMGRHGANFIRALAASPAAAQVETLSIGWSHDLYGGQEGVQDYSDIVACLAQHQWPSLRTLSLGGFELLYNGHAAYGRIGNITKLLTGMPGLEELDLAGNFVLDQPLQHAKLKVLDVILDDPVTGMNGGAPSQASIEAVLASDLPALGNLGLDLECTPDDDTTADYAFDPDSLGRDRFPALKRFMLAYAGSEENLAAMTVRAREEWPDAELDFERVEES